ncbi:hypothetical protein Hypma_013434 [Hypsizygus marmoreus]|uniref:Uncharacterized protein n=1 Tax=Hypsizygus marmoreus TaxID=39966 RepID=A0A369JHL2_HYPMA|nr:hypothetical protein Hypma_013434 [Hypsizygus marmoreus]
MEYLYRNSNGEFIQPRFEISSDTDFSWGHLSKTSLVIAKAARALKDVPVEEYSKKTGPSGEYLELDWSREVDWFRGDRTWRTHIPVQSPDNVESWFNEFQTTAWGSAGIEIDDNGHYVLNGEWRDTCLMDLSSIADCCNAIREDSIYPKGNPIPQIFRDNIESTVYRTIHEAEIQAATLKRYMIDGVGFVWWFKEMFRGWEQGLSEGTVDRIHHWTMGLTAKRGVLLDLSRDWTSIDIAKLVSLDVPVAYAWTANEANDPRFQRLSPEFAHMYWTYASKIPGNQEGYFGVPNLSSTFPAVSDYDIFLQNGMKGFHDDGFRPGIEWDDRRVFICDFEGWKRREVTNREVKIALRTRYYARTVIVDREQVLLYWRFRPRPQEDVRAIMDVDGATEDLHEIRALHQFHHAPHSGRTYDKERGEIAYPQPTTTPDHPHTARFEDFRHGKRSLTLSSYAATSSSSSRDRGTSRVRPYPRNPDRGPPTLRTASERGRPDSQLTPPSLAARLGDPRDGSSTPVLARRLASPNPTLDDYPTISDIDRAEREEQPRDDSSEDGASSDGIEPLTRIFAHAEWRTSAREWSKGILTGVPWWVPRADRVWSPKVLADGVLQLPSWESTIRMKLRATIDETEDITDIMSWAIANRLRFSIGYPDTSLTRFAPPEITDLARCWGALYSDGHSEVILHFERGAADFIQQWRAAAREVLLRPHARAVIFQGGPLSWIAGLFRKDDLLAEAMEGPSIQVTIHRRGDLDTNHPELTWNDRLSIDECNLLYGFTKGEKGKPDTDRTLWPTETHLRDFIDGYSGSWSRTCEILYGDIWTKIRSDAWEPRTRGGWGQFLRNRRYKDTEGPRPPTLEDWDKVDAEIDLHFWSTREWDGKHLNAVELPLQFTT